jgi:hypothetical protein
MRAPSVEDLVVMFGVMQDKIKRLENSRAEDPHLIGGTGEPPFQSPWVNFDNSSATPSVTPGHRNACFYRDGDHVHIAGVVKSGSSSSVIFILPVGFRPEANRSFIVGSGSGIALLIVETNGEVTPINLASGNVTTDLSLDGSYFRVT